MTLILCGFQCCGKTSCGKEAAALLGWNFIDTDVLLGDCRSFYKKFGEVAFRQKEKEIILSLKPEFSSIIAIGGGALLDEESALWLKSLGTILYLKTEEKILYKRILQRGIPAFFDPQNPYQSLIKMASERFPLYEKHADLIFDTKGKSVQEIAGKVYSLYGQ